MVLFGPDQEEFIRDVRKQVETNPCYLDNRDWRNINPRGGQNLRLKSADKVFVGSFYVKPIVMFLPHLILPNHTPTCPQCETQKYVDLSAKTRWVKNPKILFGIDSHRYIDTQYYYCRGCCKSFLGYNQRSLELDSKHWVGLMDFHLSKTYAIDAQLHSDIVNSTNQQSRAIAERYRQRVTDKYFRDQHFYLYAVRAEKIRAQRPLGVSCNDRQQPTLDNIVVAGQNSNLSPNQKTQQDLRSLLQRSRFSLMGAESLLNDTMDFKDIIALKLQRNARNPPLKGIGVAKLQELMRLKIRNGRQLLDFIDMDGKFNREVLAGWKRKVKAVFDGRESKVRELRQRVEDLKQQLEEINRQVELETALDERMDVEAAEAIGSPQPLPKKILPFSSIDDPTKYNARFLSSDRIESLQRHHHQHRKRIQEAKMLGLKATVLKMDFNYKIASKIRVYKGRGQSFTPYKCICTVQQDDCMTVFWKGLRGSESISEIDADLRRLRHRLYLNTGMKIRVVYVDNCCNVCNILRGIFGKDLLVKLDVFHWLSRWDSMLAEPSGELAITFRLLMSRAIFCVEPGEYLAVKNRLFKKYNRIPTNKEIMKEAKSTIPPPALLRANIEAVLRLIHIMDLKVALNNAIANRNAPDQSTGQSNNRQRKRDRPKKFLKDCMKTRDETIRKQMSHVDNGCLSDPPPDIVNVHRKNPRNGKTFVARGTNSNEADNLWIDRLTGNHVGLALAEHLIGDYFEQSNDRKRINRLGEKDPVTHRTEAMSLLNCYAKETGFTEDELPFPDLAVPTEPTGGYPKEYLGFCYACPSTEDITNHPDVMAPSTLDVVDADDVANTDDTLAEFLSGVDFEDDNPGVLNEIEVTTRDTDTDEIRRIPVSTIEENSELLMPAIAKRETTLQAFNRLTEEQPWVPFHSGGTTRKTALDYEEEAVFREKKKRFNRNAEVSAPKGYKAFEIEWNQEVTYRYYQQRIIGDDDVILINKKTAQQLAEHYDRVEAMELQATLLARNDPFHQHMVRTFRDTRNRMNPTVDAHETQAVRFPAGIAPLGVPTTYNPEYVAPSLRYQTPIQNTRMPWVVAHANGPPTQEDAANQDVVKQLRDFDRRTWCITCGYRKKEHRGMPFGVNCTREYCAKCHYLRKHHKKEKMGPYCTNEAKPESPHLQWQKQS